MIKLILTVVVTTFGFCGFTQSEKPKTIIGSWHLAETWLEEGRVFNIDDFGEYFNYQWKNSYADKGLTDADSLEKRSIAKSKFARMSDTFLEIRPDSGYTYTSGNIKREGKYRRVDNNSLADETPWASLPIEYSIDSQGRMILVNRTHMYMKNVFVRKDK